MGTRAPDRKEGILSGAVFFLFLSKLLHEAAHGGCGLGLLLPGGVGVGAQGEAGVEVAQHGGYSFYVHSVLQSGSWRNIQFDSLVQSTKMHEHRRRAAKRRPYILSDCHLLSGYGIIAEDTWISRPFSRP